LAFVDVCAASAAIDSVAGVSQVAIACVGTIVVSAAGIDIAFIVVIVGAFIDIGACESIASPSRVASAFKGAFGVDTASIDVAVVE